MFEHGRNLSARHPGKPFQKLIDRGAGFKIFEECSHRYTSAAKDPCAAYSVFSTFDFSAIRPIQHPEHDMLCVSNWASSLIPKTYRKGRRGFRKGTQRKNSLSNKIEINCIVNEHQRTVHAFPI